LFFFCVSLSATALRRFLIPERCALLRAFWDIFLWDLVSIWDTRRFYGIWGISNGVIFYICKAFEGFGNRDKIPFWVGVIFFVTFDAFFFAACFLRMGLAALVWILIFCGIRIYKFFF
jgi:hypothetical protein